MFEFLKKKSAPTEKKSIGISQNYTELSTVMALLKARWTNRDYGSLAYEGYVKNVIAYHCITRIAQCVAEIPFDLLINGSEVENHPLLNVLRRPNPRESYNTFMRNAVMHREISGNIYILGNIVSEKNTELYAIRPDRVNIITNGFEQPVAYTYTINGKVTRYNIDPITWESDVLHIKLPNPLDDLYGLSPIQAAIMSIDQHNESSVWNKALLQNSARPTGILSFKGTNDIPDLDADQFNLLKQQFNEQYAGQDNAGKPILLNTNMIWQNTGLSPVDMDWINGKNTTARDICLAFGYPAMLLGMPEGATFNNVAEAKLSLYEETIIPTANNIFEELGHFLSTHFNKKIELVTDLDGIPALTPRREIARKNARDDVNAGIISINEAREESGYDEVENGDDILVPANRLPLNFDSEGLDKETEKDPETISKSIYIEYLVKQASYSQEDAEKLANKVYE